jgi:hypothetical protein
MKYIIETTPEEQSALYGMMENIVTRLCKTAVKMEKLRSQRHARTSQQVVADAKETTLPHDEDAGEDNDEVVNKVIRFDRHERPTGAEVGRGDDRGLSPREEAPLPAETVMDEKKLRSGKTAFDKLVRLWVRGFGVEGEEQPDRAEAMRNLANSPKSFNVLAYVKAAGGVTWAVNAAEVTAIHTLPEGERERLVTDLAGNITQVASILFPDLSDMYEYKDIFATNRDEEYDDGDE